MNLHDFQKALFKLNTERFLKRWGSNWTLQFGARIWNCFVWRGWELQDWVSDPVHRNRRIDASTYFWPYAACAVVCFSDVCSLKKQSSSFTSDTWERNLQLCFASLCEWRAFWVSRLQDDILHIYCTRANNPTKATFLLEQKISGGRVRAPWKRRCCGFFSQWKYQQVLLWTSFLRGEEAEQVEAGCRCEGTEYFGLSGRPLSVTPTWNQLVTTGYHLLLLWTVRCQREAVRCKTWRAGARVYFKGCEGGCSAERLRKPARRPRITSKPRPDVKL